MDKLLKTEITIPNDESQYIKFTLDLLGEVFIYLRMKTEEAAKNLQPEKIDLFLS